MQSSITYSLGLKNDSNFEFIEKHSLENRIKMAKKHGINNQIIVVCEPHKLLISRHKDQQFQIPIIIVNKHDTVSYIYQVIKRKLALNSTADALFLFCQNKILQIEDKLEDVFQRYVNQEDQILYIKFCTQEAFGNI